MTSIDVWSVWIASDHFHPRISRVGRQQITSDRSNLLPLSVHRLHISDVMLQHHHRQQGSFISSSAPQCTTTYLRVSSNTLSSQVKSSQVYLSTLRPKWPNMSLCYMPNPVTTLKLSSVIYRFLFNLKPSLTSLNHQNLCFLSLEDITRDLVVKMFPPSDSSSAPQF